MGAFGIGPGELVLALIIALIVFGPAKLPELGAQVGRGIREFRRASSELTNEISRQIEEVEHQQALKQQPAPRPLVPESVPAAASFGTPAAPQSEAPIESNDAPDAVTEPAPANSLTETDSAIFEEHIAEQGWERAGEPDVDVASPESTMSVETPDAVVATPKTREAVSRTKRQYRRRERSSVELGEN